MSSAFYPLGMSSYNNRLPQGGYKSWKGKGIYSNPVGVTSGNMRPLTNRDPLNDAVYKFGLPRPIKHYRRGISIPVPVLEDNIQNPERKKAQTYYYSNREVKSSVQDKMVAQLQDRPGSFIVKNNTINSTGLTEKDCQTCKGIGIVSSWYPINNLSEKPEPNVTNPLLCCNQEQKARKRVLPASTIVKKNYYPNFSQYLYNRCNTYTQKSFAYLTNVRDIPQVAELANMYPFLSNYLYNVTKPGSPLSILNEYTANCNCNFTTPATNETILIIYLKLLKQRSIINDKELEANRVNSFETLLIYLNTLEPVLREKALLLLTEIYSTNPNDYGALLAGTKGGCRVGCQRVYYKPNNYQFAQEGAVSSSTRTLKKNVTTIELNASNLYGSRFSELYKQKSAKCEPGIYTQDGNPKTCSPLSNDYNSANSKYAPNYKVLNLNSLARI